MAGLSTGRRWTRRVETTYGAGQRDRDHRAHWSAIRTAEFAVEAHEGAQAKCGPCGAHIVKLGGAWTATADGTTTCYADPSPEYAPHAPGEVPGA